MKFYFVCVPCSNMLIPLMLKELPYVFTNCSQCDASFQFTSDVYITQFVLTTLYSFKEAL